MHKLRNVLLLSFLLSLGGTLVANGLEGTGVFDNSNKKSDAKQEKSKTKAKDNSGHRKHWYSPPHWFHRKHDKNSSKSKTNPFDKPASGTVATKPAGKAAATTSAAGKTGGTASTKTVAAHPGTKTGTAARRHRKACTPEQAKKGGCTVDKAHSQKGSSNPS